MLAKASSRSRARSRPWWRSRAGPTWSLRKLAALGVVALAATAIALVLWDAGTAAAVARPGVDTVTRYASIGNDRVILLIPEGICPSLEIQLLLLDTATESLRYAEDFFGGYLSHPIVHLWLNAGEKPESVVPPTGAFALATCRVTDESGTVPQTPDEVRTYSFLMVHEYSHLVHMLHMHRTYPALAEGFASLAPEYARRDGLQDGELREATPDDARDAQWVLPPHITAASALEAGILPPIRQILTLGHSGQAWNQWMLYTVPTSLLGFIDEEFGRPTLTDIFRHCPEATGPTGQAAEAGSAHHELFDTFERHTGVPMDELEAQWHRRLAELNVDSRSVAAVKLLKDLDRVDMTSLLWALRARGKKLDPEFLKALAELRADILRFGSLSVSITTPGSDIAAGDVGLSEESLPERIDRLAEWAHELWRKAYE
jgi:hypothetical protein